MQFRIQEFENITIDNFRVSNKYFTEKPTFLQFTIVLFLNGFSLQNTTAADSIKQINPYCLPRSPNDVNVPLPSLLCMEHVRVVW